MSEQKLYKVLRESPFFFLRDAKAPDGVSYPVKGDTVALSEAAAEHLVHEGWVEPAPAEGAELSPPRPRAKKTRPEGLELQVEKPISFQVGEGAPESVSVTPKPEVN